MDLGYFRFVLWNMGLYKKNKCPYCGSKMIERRSYNNIASYETFECETKGCRFRE